MPVARLAGMIDLRVHGRGDVLDQRPAGRHVHHLHAEADAERGDATLARQPGQADVVLLPPRIHRLAARMLFLAVRGTVEVIAPAVEEAVAPVEAVLRT